MGGDSVQMARFHISSGGYIVNPDTGSIIISGNDCNHIKNVLRMKPGDGITVVDSCGAEYRCRIESFIDRNVIVRVSDILYNADKKEPPVDITLFQGIPKSGKMEYIIQKSVELGIRAIVPMLTSRTVVKFNDNRDSENKLKRWRKIACEAANQCGRSFVPEIRLPQEFSASLASSRDSYLSIMPYEKETDVRLGDIIRGKALSKHQVISVFIGPEGGFSEDEAKQAASCGVSTVTLGPRILRTETAGIAVISILMYEMGDM